MDISNLSAYQGLLSSQISNQKTNELKGVLNNAAEKTDDELMDACKEFEAYFLEQVFKGMEKTVVKADNSSSIRFCSAVSLSTSPLQSCRSVFPWALFVL